MDHDGIALPDIRFERIQLSAVSAFARRLIGKGAIHRHAVQLPVGMLVGGTHPHVADPLPDHVHSPCSTKSGSRIHFCQ